METLIPLSLGDAPALAAAHEVLDLIKKALDPGRTDDPRPSSAPGCDLAMSRFADGDDRAFDELYPELELRLMGWLMRQMRDRAAAQDLFQDTCLRMCQARGTFLRHAQVMPWAFAIARRLLIDEVRRSQRRNRVMDGGEAPDVGDAHAHSGYDHVHVSQIVEQFEAGLMRLPEQQREAFVLMRMEGLTLCEAAQVSGATVSAIKSRSHRAYETLREAMKDLLGRSSD